MNLDVRIQLGMVNSGGNPKNPAWVSLPKSMPYYGTSAFRQTMVPLFIRKSFLEKASTEEVASAISHELSHIILEGLHHPLRTKEEAVDLTAMILGFAEAYETVHGNRTGFSLGYLSAREVRYAVRILRGRPARGEPLPRLPLGLILSVLGLIATFVGAIVEWPARYNGKAEDRPIASTDNLLSDEQIRYCLSEQIRLDGARRIVNQYNWEQVSRFNSFVSDYNARCGSFKYEASAMEAIKAGVEERRNALEAEGAERIRP
jgi:hypothetical protein